jgi:response regulator RpfG family c-di-GMP phosphodiesterase
MSPTVDFKLPVMIVVVEDSQAQNSLAVGGLLESGFCIIEAPDTEEALQILGFLACDIDILFADLDSIGEQAVLELASLVSIRWPWVWVVLTSASAKPTRGVPAFSRFIAKPYIMTDVVEKIRQLRTIH